MHSGSHAGCDRPTLTGDGAIQFKCRRDILGADCQGCGVGHYIAWQHILTDVIIAEDPGAPGIQSGTGEMGPATRVQV